MSLRIRIALAVALLGSLLVGGVLSITLTDLLDGGRHQLRVSEQVMMGLLADHSRDALLTEDYGDLQAHLERATRHPRLRAAIVADTRGQVVVATAPALIGTRFTPPANGEGTSWRTRSINGHINPLGRMAVEFSDRPYVAAYQQARALGLTIAGIGILASALIGLLIGHLLTIRLHALADAADRVDSQTNPSLLNVCTDGRDEVSRLGRAFTNMVARLQESYEELRLARDRLLQPTEAMSQGFALWDAEDRLVLRNRRFCEIFAPTSHHVPEGATFAELRRVAPDLIAPDTPNEPDGARRLARHRNPEGSLLVPLEDGRFLEIRESRTPDGGTVAIYTDVTRERRQQLELVASERRLRAMMDSVFDAVVTTDGRGRIESLNPSAERIFGWCRDDALGLPISVLVAVPEAPDAQPRATFERLTAITSDALAEMNGRHRSGRIFPIEASSARIDLDASTSMLFTIRDISERKANELRIVHHATHDRLTALPNRSLLEQRLEEALRGQDGRIEPLAVMFLDLDRFKAINDDFGHQVGDGVLVKVAERLRAVAGPPHTVARLGGDEFIVLIRLERSETCVSEMASRIVTDLRRPIRLRGREVRVTASLGISLHPEHGGSAEALFRHADLALYQSKSTGRDCVSFYRPDMSIRGQRQALIESHLRRALGGGELELHYQPEIDLATGEVCCLEALTRWPRGHLGTISPDEFIPIAEESALAATLGHWVLDRVCREIRDWRHRGLAVPRVAINVSARELDQDTFAAHLLSTLDRHAIEPGRIELELTERVLMRERGIRHLERLAEAGVGLTLDDFGTGHWSLGHLKRCPIRRLKIDRSLIQGLDGSARDVPLIQATIAMAEAFAVEVVAEGIEDAGQWQLLRQAGCRFGQGFFICRPLPPGELTGLLGRDPQVVTAPPGEEGGGKVLQLRPRVAGETG